MIKFKNIKGHFLTVTRHRHMVFKHALKAGIPIRGILHDLSKYSPSEFISGIKYYSNGKKSPNEAERIIYGYSSAWLHHKGRNKHHFEYWNDYNPKYGKVMPVDMPKKYFKELLCDRIAASKIYQGCDYNQKHPLEYYLNGDSKRFISPKTSENIIYFLSVLAEDGEEEMFKQLREF